MTRSQDTSDTADRSRPDEETTTSTELKESIDEALTGLPARPLKEVRLALVCYGGVSLAIYMHGMTKELQRLVVASTAYDRGDGTNPFSPDTTEHAWWNFLDAQAGAGVRLRVVVDIISGTSAGGINGIFLAKALATNRSQDVLTDIWLGRGDFDLLLRGPKRFSVRARAALYGLRLIARPTRIPAPLFGDRMSEWLIEGFDAMEAAPQALPSLKPNESLVPRGQSLDLFVPITDYNGRTRMLPIQSPKWLSDTSHKHVMSFRHEDNYTQFGPSENGALGFAARATSSFPGGFPPISIRTFEQAVKVAFPEKELRFDFPRHFPHYCLDDEDPSDRWFVDGGVLDNAPFGASIDAIHRKPAATEVDRRLLYVEPDPAAATATDREPSKIPNIPKTIWAGLAAIPRQEPVIDDLLRLMQRNNDVERVQDVIASSFSTISERVRSMIGVSDSFPTSLSVDDIEKHFEIATSSATHDAGMSVATYARLRVRSVIDGFSWQLNQAANFPGGSFHADFVADLMREWATGAGLFDQAPTVTDQQLAFMDCFDLGYYERQVRFAINALSGWYHRDEGAAPPRASLDWGKERLYQRLDEAGKVYKDLASCNGVQAALETVFSKETIVSALDSQISTRQLIEQNASTLAAMESDARAHLTRVVPDWRRSVHADILQLTSDWPAAQRDEMLVRYLGFPFWDVLTFPVQILSGVNERDGVEVARLSPRDVHLLDGVVEGAKLAGIGFHHFGAFFGRAERENDYLWGRLDAIERLVAIVSDDPAQPDLSPPNARACAELFKAVLDEEAPKLKAIESLTSRLRGAVSNL